MSTFEEIFNNSVLAVITPEASLGFPSQDDSPSWGDWVARLETESTDRKMAFFDENLEVFLALRFEHFATDTEDTSKPPPRLLSYLAHLQVSYEASYITSIPQAPSPALSEARPFVPPRSHSMPGRNKPSPLGPPATSLAPPHPSIFPPHTPHPIPSSMESDRQYVQAQGTLLRAGTWGDGSAAPDSEGFALVWSKLAGCWIAIFRLTVQVAFIPTKVADPLLCLTVSTTLRERPVLVTSARKTLTALIEASEELDVNDPTTPLVKSPGEDEDVLNGLEEVNLLDGLSGPTFSETPLRLPSSRAGDSIRKQAFGILTTEENLASPLTSTPTTYRPQHPTLRKSFRKTLRTVSGFRVRMRTVFVPYFMLPQPGKKPPTKRRSIMPGKAEDSDTDDDPLDIHERELLEAGSEEHTVVLCVEVENGGEASAGFAVESVKVSVGGEGAQTRLIGWGESGFLQSDLVFPLLIGPFEQYNLLYAVTFTRSPEVDEFSLARGRGLPGIPMLQDMQRAVAIIINGRPYEVTYEDRPADAPPKPEEFIYPTSTFPSRWNCVLDLSPQTNNRRASTGLGGPSNHEAMPTPASPFPGAVTSPRPGSAVAVRQGNMLKPGTPGSAKTPVAAVAGSKRFTLSAMDAQTNATDSYFDLGKPHTMKSPVDYRSGKSLLNPANQRDPFAQSGLAQSLPTTPTALFPLNPITRPTSYLPPSATMKNFSRTPTTTYGPLSPPLPSLPRVHSYGHVPDDSISSQIADIIPPTPAYPAFPASPPPSTPHWQGPVTNMQSGAVGPSVEIRREKGPNAAGIPRTPGPTVSAAGGFVQMQSQGETLRGVVTSDGPGEPVVVSVGLLRDGEGEGTSAGIGRIYPLDQFTLDIFVFNRSSWTRRFEVSYPDRRKQRRDKMYLDAAAGVDSRAGSGNATGIIPLANRVRIGPLLPSTCQSVRMDFLALTPGVHSVDTLTLTDIQSGFSMNLRSVMDIVVHEPELPREMNTVNMGTITVS